MKKKQGLIFLSVLIMITSITLLINKSSYAGEVPASNYCPEKVILNKTKTLELIEGLPLSNLEVKGTNGESLNNTALAISKDTEISDTQELEIIGQTLVPIPKFSDNKEENSYYSQLFFWWINDIDYQTNNLIEEEKALIKNSPNGKKVVEKIEEYERYNNWLYSDNQSAPMLDEINIDNITYYVTDDYIETSLITPDCTKDYSYMFTDYEVKVPSPITVVDKNGNEKQEFERGEGFKLRVPLSEVKNGTVNMKAEIIGNTTFNTRATYQLSSPSTNTRALILPLALIDCGESETMQGFLPLELNYTEQVGTLNIKVIDAETKENLSNAEITIYDSLGNIVYRMNTTNSEINVTLPIGEYTVKQTITPENYQARVIEQKVTIVENETTEAVLENIQLLEVPNLGRNTTGIIMIIGGLVLVIGCIIVGVNLRKKDIKTKN